MNVFDHNSYRKILNLRLKLMPKQGHGQAKKLAEYLGVSTTLISQILSEQKHFTMDQAFMSCEFFSLNELETKYFITLVQVERSASQSFRKSLQKDLAQYREDSQKLEKRLTHQQVLNEEQKAIFYSDWYYSAIRMLTSIGGYDSVESIAAYFGLPKKIVASALHFLEAAQLIVQENNKFRIGNLSTHVNAESNWVKLHHNNWRFKAIEYMNYPDNQKLHYTSPMTLSIADAEKIRMKLVTMIGEVGKIVDDSPAKELMCLNLDWFRVAGK